MRTVGAAVAATIAFFIYGYVIHGRLIAKDYLPYPSGVYRAGEDAQSHVAFGLAGIFVANPDLHTHLLENRQWSCCRGTAGVAFRDLHGWRLCGGQFWHHSYQWETGGRTRIKRPDRVDDRRYRGGFCEQAAWRTWQSLTPRRLPRQLG